MKDQNKDNKMLQPTADRNEKGQFAPGNKIPHKPYMRYADRSAMLQEMYTPEQILELAADKKKLFKLPVIDAQIIKRIAVTLTDVAPTSRTEIRQEMEAHLNRIEGTPTQRTEITGREGGAIEMKDVTKSDADILAQYLNQKGETNAN